MMTRSPASANTGQKQAEHKIAAVPVWDGLIAAEGKLFVSLMNGSVVCFGHAASTRR